MKAHDMRASISEVFVSFPDGALRRARRARAAPDTFAMIFSTLCRATAPRAARRRDRVWSSTRCCAGGVVSMSFKNSCTMSLLVSSQFVMPSSYALLVSDLVASPGSGARDSRTWMGTKVSLEIVQRRISRSLNRRIAWIIVPWYPCVLSKGDACVLVFSAFVIRGACIALNKGVRVLTPGAFIPSPAEVIR